ncbi:MAG TPA: OmpA family protein, partial [Chryseosolibacter sp.]|nr:OmpA family protein [Chryseosolibacter sp.]
DASGQNSFARYELAKMDKTINTFHHEAAPIISPDGTTLYFFVMNHPENTMGKDDTQDIWMSKRQADGTWSQAQHLTSPFNIHPSNQLFTILPDGSLFVKGGKSKGKKGFSIIRGGNLRELDVKDFGKMNKGRFYGATMSSDMRHIIIYFSEVENSPISDLYASHLQADGSYSTPAKLKISTNADDLGPFIGPDQKTLFFSSARQAPGRQGNSDIYKCERLDDTWANWSTPVNLGKPINTSAEDFYFTMDDQGNVFTSRANKAMEGMQLDLYMLVPKNIRINLEGMVLNEKTRDPVAATVEIKMKDRSAIPLKSGADGLFKTRFQETDQYRVSASAAGFQPNELTFTVPLLYADTTIQIEVPLTPVAKTLILTGNVYDQKTSKLVPANLEVNLSGDRRQSFATRAEEGRFEQAIPKLGRYILTASADGYLNATDSVEVDSEDRTPFNKDIYLQPIEVGVTVRLKNIYFDFDKFTLKQESFIELNKVVEFLKHNPTVEIEISGHTDNKGSDEYNTNLSQGRSQEVVNYLISQGIQAERLSAHGYGESKPIDSNETDDGRANNRRVEFTILKK